MRQVTYTSFIFGSVSYRCYIEFLSKSSCCIAERAVYFFVKVNKFWCAVAVVVVGGGGGCVSQVF